MVRVATIAQTISLASRIEQSRLRLLPNDGVVRILRVRSDDDRPVASDLVVIPEKLVVGLDEAIPDDLDELSQKLGIAPGIAVETLRVVKASRMVAEHLGVKPEQKVVRLDRVAHSVAGTPFEWRVSFRPR
jgi:GntR family transcriptional regulator